MIDGGEQHGDARAVIRRYNATSSVIGRDRSPMCANAVPRSADG